MARNCVNDRDFSQCFVPLFPIAISLMIYYYLSMGRANGSGVEGVHDDNRKQGMSATLNLETCDSETRMLLHIPFNNKGLPNA